jgi:hypothetical protein
MAARCPCLEWDGTGWIRAAGDWLQGPYVYYLYSQYGFDKGDIGRLFIAGFGSSMLFGTIVGSLADKQYARSPSPAIPFPYSNPDSSPNPMWLLTDESLVLCLL